MPDPSPLTTTACPADRCACCRTAEADLVCGLECPAWSGEGLCASCYHRVLRDARAVARREEAP